ncbi:glycosyltransferase family 4 protein [Klebsiella quasipneumoniae]|uniref:glycosyltransferase family 4 protein n=1 Tax=Klebsiella quasipneumoniae TaxID=1463165 RepID=UPI003F6DC1DB
MIYINGRFLLQRVTGVQRFSFELIKSLVEIRDDIIILLPEGEVKYDLTFLDGNKNKIEVIQGGKGHFWEQFTLPAYLIMRKSPLLINLCNTAPVIYKNQIVTHHDITYKKYPKSFSLPFRFFYNTAPRAFLKNSKFVITVSEFSKNEICNHYKIDKNKVSVVYNAVSGAFSVAKENNSPGIVRPYFLAVSSHAYHKNFHGLIEEFSCLPSDINIELKIIGSGANSFKVDGLQAGNENIKFIGRVADDELVYLYQNAIGFIFPSLYEGFGIPPLEAQACGCPVIASDRSVMPEVLQDSVLYFNPLEKNDLCSKIVEFMATPSISDRLREKGFNNIKRFSWGQSAQKLNGIINKHLKKEG